MAPLPQPIALTVQTDLFPFRPLPRAGPSRATAAQGPGSRISPAHALKLIAEVARGRAVATKYEIFDWLRHSDERVALAVLREHAIVLSKDHRDLAYNLALHWAQEEGALWTPLLDATMMRRESHSRPGIPHLAYGPDRGRLYENILRIDRWLQTVTDQAQLLQLYAFESKSVHLRLLMNARALAPEWVRYSCEMHPDLPYLLLMAPSLDRAVHATLVDLLIDHAAAARDYDLFKDIAAIAHYGAKGDFSFDACARLEALASAHRSTADPELLLAIEQLQEHVADSLERVPRPQPVKPDAMTTLLTSTSNRIRFAAMAIIPECAHPTE
jgi:hypothetical protein